VPVSSVTNSGRKERGALEAPLSVRLDRLVSEPVLQVVGGEATLDLLSGLTGALLDASDQFLVVALGNVEIVVGQVPPGLLDLAFELVPATFPLHTGSFVSHGSLPLLRGWGGITRPGRRPNRGGKSAVFL